LFLQEQIKGIIISALIMFDIPAANTEEGDALIAKAQKVRKWGETL
jgi:hypothetical protein